MDTTLTTLALGAALGSLSTALLHFPLRRERTTLRRSHLGILSSAAIRNELRRLQRQRKRYDVLAMDVRKMHELNAVLGYARTNQMIHDWLTSTLRADDVAGQWGGDEIVVVVASGQGQGVLDRLIAATVAISDAMAMNERDALRILTRGLVDGLHIAACIAFDVTRPYDAAVVALDKANTLKSGRQTGERATSGAAGTLIAVWGAR